MKKEQSVKCKVFSVSLPSDLHQKLVTLAHAEDRSLSRVIRRLVAELVEKAAK